MGRTWMILAALAALLALAPAAHADDFTVNSPADVDGTCAGEQCTIRQALGSAARTTGPDVVNIPEGTYTLTLGALAIGTEVTLRGAGARTTTITASANARAVEVTSTTATLTALTISGGTATAGAGFHGGNIRSQSANVVLDRVRVTGGRAYSGGGIANRNGEMTIVNSLVDHNQAPDGGGDGGGILNFGGDGGTAASLTMRNSTIAFNTARLAGGLISYGSPQDSVTLDGVTIARNSGGDRGIGGVSPGFDQGVISARSTIVADNDAQGLPSNCGGGVLMSQGFNIESGAECGFNLGSDRDEVDALLAAELTNAGGQTDVLLPSPLSPAINLNGDAAACGGTDQRGVGRPLGPSCDAGAVELDYEVRIESGPTWTATGTAVEFAFSSARPGAKFECALDRPGGPAGEFGQCSGAGSATYGSLVSGVYTFRVRAIVDGEPIGAPPREFTVGPTVTVTSSHSSPTTESTVDVAFTASAGAVRIECRHVFPDGSDEVEETCESPKGWRDLIDGTHRFELTAFDDSGNRGPRTTITVVVDRIGPDPVEPTMPEPGAFVFSTAEPGVAFECRLQGPAGDTGFVVCQSPRRYENLVPGEYTFTLVAIDSLGNRGVESRRVFSVAVPQRQPTATPEPIATPRPTPTPTPTPEAGETVVARPVSGRILVKRPNSPGFVELRGSNSIPVGSEVNAKNGRVALTIEPGNGKPIQRAVFYAGIFKISQPGATLDLTLSEPLAACKKARAAQAKAKSRKLWGDGKGKFRTKGRYSAATVRGTIWLVQDSCEGTLTRVRQGVVSVRDSARGKTVLVRAGRSYLAKPRRR